MKTTFVMVLGCVALTGCPAKSGAKGDDAGAATPSAAAVAAASAAAPASAAASAAAPTARSAPNASASASASAAAKPTNAVPSCAKGQAIGTEAMSPFKPFCGQRCKTDADCTKFSCMEVNELTPDGMSNDKLVKVCNPSFAK